jgi:imidazolonepropionase-like amidohydrolase
MIRVATVCFLLTGLAFQPAPVTLLRAGRFFDSKAGVMMPARDILVRGGTIERIDPVIPPPAGARVIDLRRYTVLPGLIDAHTHLLLEVEPYSPVTRATVLEGEAARSRRGAVHARSYLEAGFTSIRDLGNAGQFGDVTLARAIAAGALPGPRMQVAGPGLSAAGGQIEGSDTDPDNVAAREYRILAGSADARAAVREAIARGAGVIKVYADQRPKPVALSPEELHAVVEEAHARGLRVAAHATSDAPAARAVDAGVDSIEHGYELSDATLSLMREKGIAVVPTFTDLDTAVIGPRAQQRTNVPVPPADKLSAVLADYRGRLRRLFGSGVTVAAGSDMYWNVGLARGQAAKRVLFAYEQANVERRLILQAATRNAAVLLGERRAGVLEPGAFADIIAVEGDPLNSLSALENVRFVMKDGAVILIPRDDR